MGFMDNRYYVYHENKILYHVILLVSFVVCIKLMPLFEKLVIKYFPWEMLHPFVPYVIAYFGAIYILPEFGFFITKSISED